jgi:diguanylate cyclase (GGDEF)-like protein/PAS domain S-box-containing protein
MSILATSALFASIVALLLAGYIFAEDSSSQMHRIAAMRSFSEAIVYLCAFQLIQADSYKTAAFWGYSAMTVLPMGVMIFHSVWHWTGNTLQHGKVLIAVYASAALLVVGHVLVGDFPFGPPFRADSGLWILDTTKLHPLGLASLAWLASIGIASVCAALWSYRTLHDPIERKRKQFVYLWLIFPGMLVSADIVMQPLGVMFPTLVWVYGLLSNLLLGFGIIKNRAYLLTPATAARDILAAMTEAVVLIDTRGIIRSANPAFCALAGRKEKQLLGLPISLFFPTHTTQIRQDLKDTLEQGHISSVERICRAHDGRETPVLFSTAVVNDRRGNVLGIAGLATDITERKYIEAEITETLKREQQLHAITRSISSTLDTDATLQSIVRSAVEALDADGGKIKLCNMKHGLLEKSYCTNEHDLLFQQPLCQTLFERVVNHDQALLVPDSAAIPEVYPQAASLGVSNLMAVPVVTTTETLGVLVVYNLHIARPLTRRDLAFLETIGRNAGVAIQNAQLFAETQRLATIDTLTGVYNRGHFFAIAHREFERARRYDSALSVIMFDVDYFKKINDTYGHSIGDQVLRSLAQSCHSQLREVDVLGRYGGEEFAILLPETTLFEAEQVAERLRSIIDQAPISTKLILVKATISLGVAAYDQDCIDLDQLLDRADQACYESKAGGRNQVSVWEPSAEHLERSQVGRLASSQVRRLTG